MSGNTESDPDADWTDYEAAGVDGPTALLERAVEILHAVDLEAEILGLGLSGSVDAGRHPELAAAVLEARRLLRARLQDERYRDMVEPFDADRFNSNMSVAENLLFGTPIGPTFDLEHIGDNPYVRSVLQRAGLLDEFVLTGLSVAKIMVDLFQGLPPGHSFFERFSFISAEALPEYQAVIRRVETVGVGHADEADRSLLLSLPFQIIVGRHRLGLVDEAMEARVLRARQLFASDLPAELKGAIAFFDPHAFNVAASVQDNILFGKLVYGRPQAQRDVGALIIDVINELGLRRAVVELGLAFPVGVGGTRLPAAQRQKVALARCLLKRPDLLILDQAISALDAPARASVTERLFNDGLAAGQVWVLSDAEVPPVFDRIIHFEGGRRVDEAEAYQPESGAAADAGQAAGGETGGSASG
jgi:ABC-type sugar transport system ATPase subunit